MRKWKKWLIAGGVVISALAAFFFTVCLRKTQDELTTRLLILDIDNRPLKGCILLFEYRSRWETVWYPAHAGDVSSHVRTIAVTLRRVDSGDELHQEARWGLYVPFGVGHFEFAKGSDYTLYKEGYHSASLGLHEGETRAYLRRQGPPPPFDYIDAQFYLKCLPYIDANNPLRAELLKIFKNKLEADLKARPHDAEVSETLRRINQALGEDQKGTAN